MPNTNRVPTAYVSTGNPDTVNDATLYKPGELGAKCNIVRNGAGWEYQLVQLDSGATSATSVGVVAANQLAYWKDRSVYLVTNDSNQAFPGNNNANNWRNSVAGVFRGAVTAGNYGFVLQRGQNVPVKAAGASTFVAGEYVIANSGTAADTDRVAVGTAVTYRPLGIARGAASGGNVNVDLELPEFD